LDDETKDFEKRLAKVQVAFTTLITIGSVLIALGASSIDFSSTISMDATDKPANVSQYLQHISSVKGAEGLSFMIMGVLILLVSVPLCWNRINKLK